MEFKGAFTALVTPFDASGQIDEEAYRGLIEWQIEQGIHGLVPCGTTGESATLSHEEHNRVIAICVDQAKKRVPVLAGAGSNNTSEAIELTIAAKKAKADGALHITPYYNKPTQEGLIAHFKAIAQAVDFPLVPYNVPGRTALNMLPATVARLARECPNVVGVKEATGNLQQISDLLEQVGPRFSLLSGDDFTALPTMAIGGKGVISVASNIVPKLFAEMCDSHFAGDHKKALTLHYMTQPLNRVMFLETNPIPVKVALGMMGKINPYLRLPLVPPSEANAARLRDALTVAGLLK